MLKQQNHINTIETEPEPITKKRDESSIKRSIERQGV